MTFCTIATAAKGIKEKRTAICEIVGKSKREVELLVAPVTSCPKERIRPIVREIPKVPLLVETPKELRYTISFSVTQEVYQEFEQVKNLLSNKLGSKLSVEAIFKELLRQQLKHKSRRAKTSGLKHSRYVPKGVRQEVRARDGYQCSYISSDGVRCSARQFLHFDHIVPWALGGATDSANLRLRCACHNQLHAENTFSKERSSLSRRSPRICFKPLSILAGEGGWGRKRPAPQSPHAADALPYKLYTTRRRS